MTGRPQRLKLAWQDADSLISAIHSREPVTGLTHDLYKYPARFSPQFARAAIGAFTSPSDLVADPFVGGGTTLVEARANGRLGIGTDISTLATFVSKTKTRVLSNRDIEFLSKWFETLPGRINLNKKSKGGTLAELGYTRNLDTPQTWTIRKAIELTLEAVGQIRSNRRQDFARCILLRTAQWALDNRQEIPSVEKFRQRIVDIAATLLSGAREFASIARKQDAMASANGRHRTICLNRRAEKLADHIRYSDRKGPKLIVTSPPYPGVHILYHRWQVNGRRETPGPFWIANQLDGSGEAYYLMHARQSDLTKYMTGIKSAFSSMGSIANKKTTFLQLMAFSNPGEQLPHYLHTMEECGLQEHLLSDCLDSNDGRLWREIPGRKWHANSKGTLASSKEVVLIHKAR